jgi:hypothetical protein
LDELKPFLDQLSTDHPSQIIWSAWSILIRAQMALSERRFPETKTKCQQALAVIVHGRENSKNPKIAINTEAAIKATLGLAYVFSDEVSTGLRLCNEAIQLATAADQRSSDDTSAKLTLAEALLESGNAKGALETAKLAQPELSSRRRKESEWRAWSIAARASQKLGDLEGMRIQIGQAMAILDELKQKWGADAFRSYSARSDIQACQKRLGQPSDI